MTNSFDVTIVCVSYSVMEAYCPSVIFNNSLFNLVGYVAHGQLAKVSFN